MSYILMNTEMTKAILNGNKVQTRRIVKVEIIKIAHDIVVFLLNVTQRRFYKKEFFNKYAKYKKGDVLWVREPARVSTINNVDSGELMFEYLADDDLQITDKRYQVNLHKIQTPNRFTKGEKVVAKWIRNCKGVPNGCIKEMARIFLKITNIRVQRLKDISDDEIIAEGIANSKNQHCAFREEDNRNAWIKLWNKTAQKGYKWEDNPYVFVYEFEKIETGEKYHKNHGKEKVCS